MAKINCPFYICSKGCVCPLRTGRGWGYHFSQGGVYVTLEARCVSQPRGYITITIRLRARVFYEQIVNEAQPS